MKLRDLHSETAQRRFQPVKGRRIALYVLLLVAVLFTMVALYTCGGDAGKSKKAPLPAGDRGDTLLVAITHSPMSYYLYGDTIGGLNYDMLRLMAAAMGRPIRFIPVLSLEESLDALTARQVDILASLPVTAGMRDKYLFSEDVFLDRQVLVQLNGTDGKPQAASVLDLAGDTVHIEKNSPVRQRLDNLSSEIGAPVTIVPHPDLSDEYLFLKVAGGELRYAVINEKTAARMHLKHPEVNIGTPIGFTQFQAWLTRRRDVALHDSIDSWLTRFKATDRYRQLLDRYSAADTLAR